MANRMAKSVAILLLLGTVVAGAPRSAEAQTAGGPPPTRKSSVAKRVAWTVVGAAAGFGAGAWFGLHKFDDAINSDRKVWTSAIVGAVAGGVADGLLSRNIGPAPRVPPSRIAWPDRTPTLPPVNLLHNPPDLVEKVEDEDRPIALLRARIRRLAHRDAEPVRVKIVRTVRPARHDQTR